MKERIAFVPEQILPDQLIASASSPEHRLAAAVLEQAVHDLWSSPKRFRRTNHVRKEDVLVAQALEYIHSQDEEHLFSFENICSLLEVSSSWVRKHIWNVPKRSYKVSVNSSTKVNGSKRSLKFRKPYARGLGQPSKQISIPSEGRSLAWSGRRNRRASEVVFDKILSFARPRAPRPRGRTSSSRRNSTGTPSWTE